MFRFLGFASEQSLVLFFRLSLYSGRKLPRTPSPPSDGLFINFCPASSLFLDSLKVGHLGSSNQISAFFPRFYSFAFFFPPLIDPAATDRWHTEFFSPFLKRIVTISYLLENRVSRLPPTTSDVSFQPSHHHDPYQIVEPSAQTPIASPPPFSATP